MGTTVLLGAGLLLLLTRYRDTADVPLKVLFFLFLLAGYAYTVLLMSGDNLEGNASGALRLGFLAAMPMVVTVVYRLVVDRLTAVIDEISEYAVAVSRPQAAAPITPEPAGRAPQARSCPPASRWRCSRPWASCWKRRTRTASRARSSCRWRPC